MNSNTDFATVLALLSSIGMATRFFIKSQISVTAFLFSRSYLGNGPIVSTNTLSNTYKGVCIIVKGVFVCFVISQNSTNQRAHSSLRSQNSTHRSTERSSISETRVQQLSQTP